MTELPKTTLQRDKTFAPYALLLRRRVLWTVLACASALGVYLAVSLALLFSDIDRMEGNAPSLGGDLVLLLPLPLIAVVFCAFKLVRAWRPTS